MYSPPAINLLVDAVDNLLSNTIPFIVPDGYEFDGECHSLVPSSDIGYLQHAYEECLSSDDEHN